MTLFDPVERAVNVLQTGGVIAHATEGVWGFACDANNEQAIRRVLSIKHRPESKGLLVIGADVSEFAAELSGHPLRAQVEQCWPGPHTWILPNSRFGGVVTGGRDTVACRVPGNQQARTLCARFGGALVSTSANTTGSNPAVTEQEVKRAFADLLDLILSGEVLRAGQVSTMYDRSGKVVR